MTLLPAPMECVAIALGVTFPFVMLIWAQFGSIRGAGVRFGLGCVTSIVMLAALAVILPGERDPADVVSGFLLLVAALLFWNVIWSLLAFGFTLTLLTALVKAGKPLTLSQWMMAYMQGADLRTFAHNRLQLLFGTGMAKLERENLVATPFGVTAAGLMRASRLLFGIR
jgi:hypothetical protein